jgi:hypothetical protein
MAGVIDALGTVVVRFVSPPVHDSWLRLLLIGISILRLIIFWDLSREKKKAGGGGWVG